MVTGHSYSRVLVSPPHNSVGTEQSQSCRKAKYSISKAAIPLSGKAKILTREKKTGLCPLLERQNPETLLGNAEDVVEV